MLNKKKSNTEDIRGLNLVMVRRMIVEEFSRISKLRQKNMVISPSGLRLDEDCAGDAQKQL
jgi:hypothetical protein